MRQFRKPERKQRLNAALGQSMHCSSQIQLADKIVLQVADNLLLVENVAGSFAQQAIMHLIGARLADARTGRRRN